MTVLTFLVLISIASATQPADASNSGSNSKNIHTLDPDLKNVYEKGTKYQDEVLRINPLDSEAWKLKGWDLQN